MCRIKSNHTKNGHQNVLECVKSFLGHVFFLQNLISYIFVRKKSGQNLIYKLIFSMFLQVFAEVILNV